MTSTKQRKKVQVHFRRGSCRNSDFPIRFSHSYLFSLKCFVASNQESKEASQKKKNSHHVVSSHGNLHVYMDTLWGGHNSCSFLQTICNHPSNRLVYVIKLLQYSNSFVNTLVYSFRMQEFRRAIISFLRSGSLSPKRNIQVRNAPGVTLTSVSNLVNTCSAVNLNLIYTGNQLKSFNGTTGHRRLARRRADLFLLHKKGKYSTGNVKVSERV